MKVTALIENTCTSDSLKKEHGLSLLIETEDLTILFDSGQSGDFVDNANKLGLDLNDIDIAILSHGHYDHGNGLLRFLEVNDHAPVLMNKNAFEGHYYKNERYIGLNDKLKKSDRIYFTDDEYQISDNIILSTKNNDELIKPIDASNLTAYENGDYKPENFKHEHYLLINEQGKKVLFSGCSHKGIENIVNWFHPDVLIGGFHLMEVKTDEEGKKRLKKTAENLMDYETLYYSCHCTGQKQFAYLKELMQDQLKYISTGDTIII